MGCETLLENFFRISGMFFWVALVLLSVLIWTQKDKIKAAMNMKKAADKIKGMIENDEMERGG